MALDEKVKQAATIAGITAMATLPPLLIGTLVQAAYLRSYEPDQYYESPIGRIERAVDERIETWLDVSYEP